MLVDMPDRFNQPEQEQCYMLEFFVNPQQVWIISMFCRPLPVSPKQVQEFACFLETSTLASLLPAFKDFYRQELGSIISDKKVYSYQYTPSLTKVLQTIIKKVDLEPDILTNYPEIQGIAQAIAEFVQLDSESFESNRSDSVDQQQNSKKVPTDKPSPTQKESCSERKAGFPSMVLTCLGCTEIMVEGSNIRIPQLIKTDVILLPFAAKIKLYKQELLKAICALANSSGGVILFDCQEKGQQILPHGEVISQGFKQSIMQQIMEIFELFYPKITFSNNAHLSFVPVAEMMGQKQIKYKEGVYVTRLRVWNQHRQRLIFYTQGEQVFLSVRASKKGAKGQQRTQSLQIKSRAILRLVKRQFKKYYLPEGCIEEEKNLLAKHVHCFEDHRCPEPHPGRKVNKEKPKECEEVRQLSLEKEYTYTSVVIANKVPSHHIVGFFTAQKITKFQLVTPKNQVAVANGIHILFHETTPYTIQQRMDKMTSSPTKPILLMVDNAIKFRRKLLPSEVEELYKQVARHDEEGWLNYYESPDKRKQQAVLETSGKVAVIYLVLKLREKGICGPKLIRFDKNSSSLVLKEARPLK